MSVTRPTVATARFRLEGKTRTMAIQRVTGIESLNRLTTGLLDPSRREPWCVISLPAKSDTPMFDPALVFEQTDGVCQIWVVATGFLSYELASHLPAGCEVFGGSARVYPPGLAWVSDPSLAKRRFSDPDAKAIATQTNRLIADIQSAAFFAGLFAARKDTTKELSGIVKQFYANGETAVIQLEDGTLTSLSSERTVPGVSLERLLDLGQRVTGSFDTELRTFLLPISSVTERDVLAHFPSGAITVGRVKNVERRTADIEIFPNLAITMKREDVSSNPKDRLDLFFSAGDVIEVRILRNPQGRLALRMWDIDDDEPIEPALPVFPGGKPWLGAGSDEVLADDELQSEPLETFLARLGLSHDDLAETDTEADSAAKDVDTEIDQATLEVRSAPVSSRPVPGPGPRVVRDTLSKPVPQGAVAPISAPIVNAPTKSVIQDLNLTIAALKSQIIGLKARLGINSSDERKEQQMAIIAVVSERDSARESLKSERQKNAELRKELRLAKQQQIVGLDYEKNRANFAPGPAGDAEWLRFEIYLSWIDRIPSHKRQASPLADFQIGPEFIASFTEMARGKRNKALKAIVDVLSLDEELLAARETHPLREGSGASARDRTRDDGARCMRTYIEENSAAARRLHYWALPGGGIELSRCVVHDDYEP